MQEDYGLTRVCPNSPSHMPEAGRDGVRISNNAKIMNVLQGAADPHQRQTSVLETLRLPDQSAIPLLRRALRDSEDDVRLLAYALLDRKEQVISSRMRKLEQRLASAERDQSFNLPQANSARLLGTHPPWIGTRRSLESPVN